LPPIEVAKVIGIDQQDLKEAFSKVAGVILEVSKSGLVPHAQKIDYPAL